MSGELSNVMEMLAGKWASAAVSATATFGIADALADGPLGLEQLATRVEADPDALRRLMRVLVGLGLFELDDDGRYGCTARGAVLRSDAQPSLRAMAQLMAAPEEMSAWAGFPHSIRTGESAFGHVHGKEKFAYMAEHPEYASLFNAAMTSFSGAQIEAIVTAYDFGDRGSVIDVGGGRGHLLGAVLSAHPALRGELFDLPRVVPQAREHLTGIGVADRCEFVCGDAFAEVSGGHDAYLLKHVIHDWNDADAGAILERCREAMHPQARVLVIEMVLSESGEDLSGHFLDLEMMVMSDGGRQRTEEEYRALFAAAGLALRRVVPTAGPICLIEGTPA